MNLPKSVKIGGIVYDIVEVERLLDADNHDKLDGQIKYNKSEISIEKNMSDQIKISTLWHEVIHGILMQADVEVEEKLITILGFAICGFVQDNKELLR